MDESSINSLNSKRNLKLPPIQGALPATVYGDQSWKTNKADPISLRKHHRTHITKDHLRARNFHPINHVDLNARVDNFPRQKAIFSSPRQQLQASTVQINLGHEFPKSYTVLPPINNKKSNSVSRTKRPNVTTSNRHTKPSSRTTQKSPVIEETKSAPKPCVSSAATALSERRRERFQEKQKAPMKENISDLQINLQRDSDIKKEHREEDALRKPSPTYILHTKCQRFGRRGGVCLENETTLTNVTDQLKEIFLRRNMEEMYLI